MRRARISERGGRCATISHCSKIGDAETAEIYHTTPDKRELKEENYFER
jgi:hypothetical protein